MFTTEKYETLYTKDLKPLYKTKIWLYMYLDKNLKGYFVLTGLSYEFLIGINSLFRRVKTNFWAKVDIEVSSFFKDKISEQKGEAFRLPPPFPQSLGLLCPI